jgi:hypothetical protein
MRVMCDERQPTERREILKNTKAGLASCTKNGTGRTPSWVR